MRLAKTHVQVQIDHPILRTLFEQSLVEREVSVTKVEVYFNVVIAIDPDILQTETSIGHNRQTSLLANFFVHRIERTTRIEGCTTTNHHPRPPQ